VAKDPNQTTNFFEGFNAKPLLPTLSIDNVSVAEGNGGTTPATFTVSISYSPVNPVTVTVNTADGTATVADNDYQAITNQVLTFQPGGPLTQTVTVEVYGDLTVEPDQTFFVKLSKVTGAIIGGHGTGTILNDDAFSVTNSLDSGPGSLRQTILDANGAPGSPHTIQFQLPAGSQSITLLTPLPTAADPLTLAIDATQNVTITLPAGASWTDDHSLTVSGAGSFTVGGIEGAGDLTVGTGGSLIATHIVQDALIIGDSPDSPATVTIAPSDAAGAPLTAIEMGATPAARPSASLAEPPASTAVPAMTTLETASAAVAALSEGAHSLNQRNVAGGQRSLTTLASFMVTSFPSDDLCPSVSAPMLAANSSPAPSEASPWPDFAPSTPISRQLDPEAIAALMDDFGAFEWSGTNGSRREATFRWDDLLASDEPSTALFALSQF
jgi:hypothetical protein